MNHQEILRQWYSLRLTEQMKRVRNISDLLGKTLIDISGAEEEGDSIIFTCSDDTRYLMFHEQDCCEYVSIEDICGDISCLLNTPITLAEDISEECTEVPTQSEYIDSYTWTWYKLATVKGYVTIRWYGESNGYYSESVDFVELPNDIDI